MTQAVTCVHRILISALFSALLRSYRKHASAPRGQGAQSELLTVTDKVPRGNHATSLPHPSPSIPITLRDISQALDPFPSPFTHPPPSSDLSCTLAKTSLPPGHPPRPQARPPKPGVGAVPKANSASPCSVLLLANAGL